MSSIGSIGRYIVVVFKMRVNLRIEERKDVNCVCIKLTREQTCSVEVT